MSESIGGKIVIGVVSSVATAGAFWAIATAGGWVQKVFIPVLPGGAVVAFDGSCPEGWTEFAEGAGKMILGAGEGTLRFRGPHRPDGAPSEVSLTKVAVGDQGGAEKHKLVKAEMPAHNHGGETGNEIHPHAGIWYDSGQPSEAWKASVNGAVAMNRDKKHTHSIAEQGGGLPHNNMPPFIALYFCKKL